MRRILIIFGLLALVIGTSAQDSLYRLVTPSAEDYIATLTEHGTALIEGTNNIRDELSYGEQYPYDVVQSIGSILFYRYPDLSGFTFEQQYRAYMALQLGNSLGDRRRIWGQRMVMTWLAENDVDLSTVTELEFEDFYITVQPRDFNTDGVNEYLLDVVKGRRIERDGCVHNAEIVDYMVVQQTDTGYQLIETGLPWKGRFPDPRRNNDTEGGMNEYYFGDLTGDDIPEWVLLTGFEFDGVSGTIYGDYGRLYILSWRDGGFTFLVPNQEDFTHYSLDRMDYAVERRACVGSIHPDTIDWVFENLDDDDALEIIVVQQHTDSWHCVWTERRIFDWDETAWVYNYSEIIAEIPTNSRHCAQRQAEERMWAGDYAAAIPLYEHGLTFEMSTDRHYNIPEKDQYMRARFAFAYLMTGQPERAEPLLTTLLDEEPLDETITEYITLLVDLTESGASSLEVCIATFNLFTVQAPAFYVGNTRDNVNGYYHPDYRPENIGCDAPAMLRRTLDNATIPADVSPAAYLEALGVNILRFIEVDMNGDGHVEWMVWPDVAGVEVFFKEDGDHYSVSYPVLDPFLRASDIQAWRLPGNAGVGIALTAFHYFDRYSHTPPWVCFYEPVCGIGGGGAPPMCSLAGDTPRPGMLRMWRFDGTGLTEVVEMYTCEESLNDFPGDEALPELTVNIYYDPDYELGFIPPPPEVTYLWNNEEQRYIRQEPSTRPARPTPPPTPVPPPAPPSYWGIMNAFEERDFETIVDMTPDTLTISDPMRRDDVLYFHYIRALSLEALGQTDEALAAYVAIYEAAPDHIWGILAHLHFAPAGG